MNIAMMQQRARIRFIELLRQDFGAYARPLMAIFGDIWDFGVLHFTLRASPLRDSRDADMLKIDWRFEPATCRHTSTGNRSADRCCRARNAYNFIGGAARGQGKLLPDFTPPPEFMILASFSAAAAGIARDTPLHADDAAAKARAGSQQFLRHA